MSSDPYLTPPCHHVITCHLLADPPPPPQVMTSFMNSPLSIEGWKELELRVVSTKAVKNVNTAIPVLHLQSGCECLSSRHHVESLCTLLGSKTNKKSLGLKKRIKYVFPRSFKKQIKLSNTKKRIFWARREGFPQVMSKEDVATEDMGFVGPLGQIIGLRHGQNWPRGWVLELYVQV